ncbi:MAG TPA: hypothetical protein VFU97_19525 [Xanthobacteraceae bacterium]|nr:hypothetical protein [Xanthobacteraceae bacterium]
MRAGLGALHQVEVMDWPDSSHCVHDRPHVCRPAMADFMRRHLAA